MRNGITALSAMLALVVGCAGDVSMTDGEDGQDSLAQESTPGEGTEGATEAPQVPTPEVPTPEAPSASAPKIPAVNGACPAFRNGTVTVNGLSGISIQAGAKKSGTPTGPLIFYWHGTGSSSAEANLMFPAAARREVLEAGGVIVAFQRSGGGGGDCSGTGTFSINDFNIADQIVACAVRDHNIDPRRIYTTGCSAGGLQAGCMASRRSGYVAAAVPNSGGIVFPQPIQDPSHVPPIMTMHGSSLDTVIVTFSQTSATLGNQFARAGGYVLNCNHGGGHCGAPGALQLAGWRFMKDHPFGADKPYEKGLPAGAFPNYCQVRTAPAGGTTGTPAPRPR